MSNVIGFGPGNSRRITGRPPIKSPQGHARLNARGLKATRRYGDHSMQVRKGR